MSASEKGSLLGDLVSEGLLIVTGLDGLYGRSGTFEQVVVGIDELVTRVTAGDGAEVVRFPPVLPRSDLETSGYLSSFPHLAGSVFGFSGSEQDAIELAARALRHDDWSEFQSALGLSLVPAACYPVYPWVARAGALPSEGRLIDVQSYCFRHEPSSDPARMQAFRMHEHVRLGPAEEVSSWHRGWIARGTEVLASIGLRSETAVASDPFFGRGGRMLTANQIEQALKLELVYPISGERPTALVSVNYHQDHFGQDFGIETATGEVAHSACFGFGLERIAIALFVEHGVDVELWPDPVRTRLSLSERNWLDH
jgi:seryl-tRNA synthetase